MIPRFCDRRLDWSRRNVRDKELDEVAEKIRAEIQNHDGEMPELK